MNNQFSITDSQRLENVENAVGNLIVSTNKRFDNVDKRFNKLETRLDNLEARFDNLEARFDNLEARFDRLETKIDKLTDIIIDNFKSHDKRLRKLESFHSIVQV